MVKPVHLQHWGWEHLFAAAKWPEINDWWQHWIFNNPSELAPLCALLSKLRDIVPKIDEENGIERQERHLSSTDDPKLWQGQEHLKGAADILEHGELEAAIEGDPPVASEEWGNTRNSIEPILQAYLRENEVTEGTNDLSRGKHARDALDLLHAIDNMAAFLSRELDTQDDKDWLKEVLAEVANFAFAAGRHTQAAWGKEFEKLAVAREKQIRALPKNSPRNEERKKTAALWHAHAMRVEKTISRDMSNSARADYILKHWNKVGIDEQRPDPPKKKTIQTWLSNRKKRLT